MSHCPPVAPPSSLVCDPLCSVGFATNQVVQQGEQWIFTYYGTRDMLKEQERVEEENKLIEYFISNVENVLLNGT